MGATRRPSTRQAHDRHDQSIRADSGAILTGFAGIDALTPAEKHEFGRRKR
jgi:hypothetical protein